MYKDLIDTFKLLALIAFMIFGLPHVLQLITSH